MSFERQLLQESRRENTLLFERAVLAVEDDWDSAPESPKGNGISLPRRSGRLRSSFRRVNYRPNGLVKSATFQVNAKSDEGFDYPEFLERTRTVRISTRTKKALRWLGPNGSPVFAKSVGPYRNQWFRWWSRWWGDTNNRWDRVLEDQLDRLGRGR